MPDAREDLLSIFEPFFGFAEGQDTDPILCPDVSEVAEVHSTPEASIADLFPDGSIEQSFADVSHYQNTFVPGLPDTVEGWEYFSTFFPAPNFAISDPPMDISSLYVTPTTSYNHPLYEATTYPSHYQSEPFYINDNDAPYVSPSAQAVVMSDVSEASDPAPPIIDCTKDTPGEEKMPADAPSGTIRKAKVATDSVRKAATKRRGHNPRWNCTLCDDSFTRQFNLEYHLDAHAGRKRFSCSTCEKRFVRPHDRARHEKSQVCSFASQLKM